MEIRVRKGPFCSTLSDTLQVVITLTEFTCQQIVAVHVTVATGAALFRCARSGQIVMSVLCKKWHFSVLSLFDHSTGFLKIAQLPTHNAHEMTFSLGVKPMC